jgi:predicted DNA-binding transcriptional regulator AlpA
MGGSAVFFCPSRGKHIMNTMLDIPTDRLLNIWDLARLFGVNRATIREWARRGRLPRPIKIGHKHQWNPREIQALLERSAAGA